MRSSPGIRGCTTRARGIWEKASGKGTTKGTGADVEEEEFYFQEIPTIGE
jgi:hypothetical protein